MITVGIVNNPFDPSAWETHETDDLCEFLIRHFGRWPETARIYDLSGLDDWTRAASIIDPAVLKTRDATPPDAAGPDFERAILRLKSLPGPVMVTVTPADPLTAIIAVVAVAAGIAASFLLLPSFSPDAQRPQSANNSLSNRTNQPRVGARIEDIVGTVEATPTLLAVPFVQFVGGIEVEEAFMCLGRGSYEVARVRDGDTNIASISGASVAIYGPFTSPNSGDPPEVQIGSAIGSEVKTVARINEVNGQTLKPSNLNRIQGEDNIRFVYPDTIETNDSSVDFTDLFGPGDALDVLQADLSGEAGLAETTASARFTLAGEIEFETIDPSVVFAGATTITIITGAYAGDASGGGTLFVNVSGTYPIDSLTSTKVVLDDPASINSDWDLIDGYTADRTEYRSTDLSVPVATSGINLNGSYTALAVTNSTITLNNPDLVNAAWDNLDDLPGGATAYVSPAISRNSETWTGPFIVDLVDGEEVLANFVALNGLYTLSKKKGKQVALSVTLEIEVTPLDSSDAPAGPAETFDITLEGSDTERTTIGGSLWATPTTPGRWSIRARRVSPTPLDTDYGGVIDEVRWKDCYGFAPVLMTDFGDVTTIHSRTVATPGALAVKDRKLNMRVTRKLPARVSGSTFGAPVATDSADDIIAALCLDPFIGRRQLSDVDFDNIYDTIAEVKAYFGSDAAGEYGFTFDDENLSFQDTMAIVSEAVFCKSFRQGSVIRMTFERATEDSTLLFNARNIIPGSQVRNFRFGEADDHDGVELDYIDGADGSAMTYRIPTDGSAFSPITVEIPGVRSDEQAYWHAWRVRNKARYQNISVDLEATQEGGLVLPSDRVLIADRTRAGVLQGEIEEEDGVELVLSHDADLDPETEWMIFIQHTDGTTEALGVSAWEPDPGDPADLRRVVLDQAPRQALATDEAYARRALYMIVPVVDVQTRAHLITEQELNRNLTVQIKAVNYSFLYYQNDQLVLWPDLTNTLFYDDSPFQTDGVATGTVGVIADSDRGRNVASLTAAGTMEFPEFTIPSSYTKAAWIRLGALTGVQGVLESNDAAEIFRLTDDTLEAGHDGSELSAEWPEALAWHHACVTYDEDSGEGALYIDGRQTAAGPLSARTPGGQTAFDGLAGRVDDLRVWRRALTRREVHEVYLGSKRVA